MEGREEPQPGRKKKEMREGKDMVATGDDVKMGQRGRIWEEMEGNGTKRRFEGERVGVNTSREKKKGKKKEKKS